MINIDDFMYESMYSLQITDIYTFFKEKKVGNEAF